jgi:hypothetical protein
MNTIRSNTQSSESRPGSDSRSLNLQHWENEGGADAQPFATPRARDRFSRVETRAYDIYLDRQRTGRPGTAASDWAQAEREIETPGRSESRM